MLRVYMLKIYTVTGLYKPLQYMDAMTRWHMNGTYLICTFEDFFGFRNVCDSFVVLKYLVMTSFRGLRQGISTYNAVFNSKVQM